MRVRICVALGTKSTGAQQQGHPQTLEPLDHAEVEEPSHLPQAEQELLQLRDDTPGRPQRPQAGLVYALRQAWQVAPHIMGVQAQQMAQACRRCGHARVLLGRVQTRSNFLKLRGPAWAERVLTAALALHISRMLSPQLRTM